MLLPFALLHTLAPFMRADGGQRPTLLCPRRPHAAQSPRKEANRLCQLFRRQINHNKQTYGIVSARNVRCTLACFLKSNVCVVEIDFSCQRARRHLFLYSILGPAKQMKERDARSADKLLGSIVLDRNYIVMSAKWIHGFILVYFFSQFFSTWKISNDIWSFVIGIPVH